MDFPEYLCVTSWFGCVSIRHTQSCHIVCLYKHKPLYLKTQPKNKPPTLCYFGKINVRLESRLFRSSRFAFLRVPAGSTLLLPAARFSAQHLSSHEVNRIWCWKLPEVRDNDNKVKIHNCYIVIWLGGTSRFLVNL